MNSTMTTDYLIELSGEFPHLAREEARSVLAAHSIEVVEHESHPAIPLFGFASTGAEADIRTAFLRMGMAWNLNRVLVQTPAPDPGSEDSWLSDLLAGLDQSDIPEGSVRVDAKILAPDVVTVYSADLRAQVKHRLGELVTRHRQVDLTHPQVIVRAILADGATVAIKLAAIDRTSFEERRSGFRPYTQPISLHPRLARAWINSGRVPAGGTVYDPFCGTGGLLLEAGLTGLRMIGSDRDPAMVAGAGDNIRHGLPGSEPVLVPADVGQVIDVITRPVDAIVTDPPYGRSTATGKEPIGSLYERMFAPMATVLKPGARLVIALPRQGAETVEFYRHCFENCFHLHEVFPLFVHKSLTRLLFVLIKKDEQAP
ncbi:MAG TPA: hypothetical protein QGF95_20530 [Candidatus Latescibacteria bacterium]|nr:hypothetical protein [Candidatus Latescibacterota bacterium]